MIDDALIGELQDTPTHCADRDGDGAQGYGRVQTHLRTARDSEPLFVERVSL